MTISIITATYNSGATIADTLRSVLHQTYEDFELLVVDGASTDNTMEIVRSFEADFKGRLRYISEPDRGLYDAMNKGLRLVTGDVVGILNSDDFFTTDHSLEHIAQAFQDEHIDASYGNLYFVHPQRPNVPIQHYSARHFRRWMLRFGFAPPHPTFYCRKTIYDRQPHFDLSMKIGADFELLLRYLFVLRLRTAYIPHDLVTMRIGGVSNANAKSRWIAMRERLKAFSKNKVYTNIFLLSFTYVYKAFKLFVAKFRKLR